jgi:hypothetical protein
MPDQNILYIHSNPAEKHIVYHGIEFYDFIRSLEPPVANLLLVKHAYNSDHIHPRSGFEYVKNAEIDELCTEVIYNFGSFCWLDFEDESMLDRLSRQDIAELLYFGHKNEPFSSPFFEALGNRCAYWSHDDGWYQSVYFSDLQEFLPVLTNAVLSRVDGKHRLVDTLPPDTVKKLFALCEGGLLLDGGDAVLSKDKAELPFYIIGSIKDIDDVLNHADAYKTGAAKKGILRFNIKSKPAAHS